MSYLILNAFLSNLIVVISVNHTFADDAHNQASMAQGERDLAHGIEGMIANPADIGENAHALLDCFRDRYGADMNLGKAKLQRLARTYDSLVARLQYLEDRSRRRRMRQSAPYSTEAEFAAVSPPTAKIFRFSAEEPEPTPSGAVACVRERADGAVQTEMRTPRALAELRSQGMKYLALGLAWRRKCEGALEALGRARRSRVSELAAMPRLSTSFL
jgi:hypothetical protein